MSFVWPLLYSLSGLLVLSGFIGLWNFAVKRWGDETVCIARNAVITVGLVVLVLLGLLGVFNNRDRGLMPEANYPIENVRSW